MIKIFKIDVTIIFGPLQFCAFQVLPGYRFLIYLDFWYTFQGCGCIRTLCLYHLNLYFNRNICLSSQKFTVVLNNSSLGGHSKCLSRQWFGEIFNSFLLTKVHDQAHTCFFKEYKLDAFLLVFLIFSKTFFTRNRWYFHWNRKTF